jgi:hypothetical protein
MHKERIAIDYMHNPNEIVGYVNKFTTDDRLVLSGALVPQKTHRRTEEIVENMKAGVPYEASIYFPPSFPGDLVIEQYEAGEAVEVNGKTVIAPEPFLTVFRKFVLRGVAICPHGADGGTAAYLQADTSAAASVEVKKVPRTGTQQTAANSDKEQKPMDDPTKTVTPPPAVQPPPAPAPAATAQAAPPPADPPAPAEPEEEEEGEEELTGSQAKLKKFTDKFGAEKAVEYLLAGKTYAEALEAYADECRAKMEAAAAQAATPPAGTGKAGATPKPSIPFEPAGEPDPDGLSAAEVAAFKQYADARGLSDAQVAKLKKWHRQSQAESRRLGVYQRSPGAVPIQEAEGGSLTKIGNE